MCLSKDQLIRYTRKLSVGAEKDAIEHHLMECRLCFDAYEGISILDSNEDALFHLNDLSRDFKIKKASGGISYKRYIISAAAVFVAAIAVLFLVLRENPESQLFNKYFKAYPNVIPIVRGEGADFNLKAALVLYNGGSYEESIIEFDKVLSTDPSNEVASFYKGVALLSLKKGGQAEQVFSKLLSEKPGMLKDQAEWYLSLSYLLNGKTTSAEELLTKISASGNYYNSKASDLLNNIRRK